MRDTKVATKAAARENTVGYQTSAPGSTCNAKRAIRQYRWSVGLVRLVIVGVLIAQDIERATR
jgi:hypothetical protein